MEIESKIMGMTVRELFERAEIAGLDLDIGWSGKVIDEYWKLPAVGLIRFRRELGGETNCRRLDLTIKGAEENDGKFTSERSEKILQLDPGMDTSHVTLFLAELGCSPVIRIEKSRMYINSSEGLRIHHDRVYAHGKDLEWVEIEADSKEELHGVLFKLFAEENIRDRVTNQSTLDICRVKQG